MPIQLALAKMTNSQLAYTNCVYLHPEDMTKIPISEGQCVMINESLIHIARADDKLKPGTLGTSTIQWQALHLDANKGAGINVTVDVWDETKYTESNEINAHTITIVVDTYSKAETFVEAEVLEQYIQQKFDKQIFCKDQRFVIAWKIGVATNWLSLRVAQVYLNPDKEDIGSQLIEKKNFPAKASGIAKLRSHKFGKITTTTNVSLMAANNPFMKLKVPQGQGLKGFGPDWDPEQLGIGGLNEQFSLIFRRAFSSRLYPPEIVKELGVKHVKGMLLYGPPGTGKTLIARSIGKMLTDKDPKVVNGPEILNKFVGQSEENIRALFADAIEDQEKNKDRAGLHIIIFDEIDAICKQRGTTGSSTGVGDTVVNQLLSMIDGVNALNNVLVIGMTNRKDLLDEALLRAGRLEVHVEISLPDEEGREQIFRIHTKLLRDNGYLDEKVSIADLAKRTKNYSGAEIEGVVRSAVSFAMQTNIDADNVNKKIDLNKLRNIKITQEYFDYALEEVKPEFGAQEDNLTNKYSRGILEYNDHIKEILHFSRTLVNKMKHSKMMNRQAILLQGDLAVGKTALACKMAIDADFPFVRIISAESFVGYGEQSILSKISKIFDDAYKSPMSIVIIDDIERIIGYTIGQRFNNSILQTILTCLRKAPIVSDRKILIICTSSVEVIDVLKIQKCFDWVRYIPYVSNSTEFKKILELSGYIENIPSPKDENLDLILKQFNHEIGISELLTILDLSLDNGIITPQSFESAWSSKFSGISQSYDKLLENLSIMSQNQPNDNKI